MIDVPEEVILRFARKNAVSIQNSSEIFKDLEAFLDQAATIGPISPNREVDEAWHEFILHTKFYEAYCQSRYGRMIHHVPSSPTGCTNEDCEAALDDLAHCSDCSSDCKGISAVDA